MAWLYLHQVYLSHFLLDWNLKCTLLSFVMSMNETFHLSHFGRPHYRKIPRLKCRIIIIEQLKLLFLESYHWRLCLQVRKHRFHC